MWRPVTLSVVLLIVLGLAVADFWVKDRTVVAPSARLQVSASGEVEPLDPTRRADDLPDLVFRDNDAYYWISYARVVLEGTRLRVHHTSIDNAPYGREVHWSSAPVWSLALLSLGHRLVTGAGVAHSLEAAALWVHPILLGILVLTTGLLAARRVSGFVAGAVASNVLLAPVLAADAGYGMVDHHAFLNVCILGMLGCLLLGGAGVVAWQDEAGRRAARVRSRRWMIASAILGGAGLWIQASFQSLLIAGAAAGSLLGIALLLRRGSRSLEGIEIVPELWRTWGIAGATTSLVFYLLEYFPFHMGMRLEVNHPLYAVAFLAGGEMTCRLARLCIEPTRERLQREGPVVLVCASGGLLLPLAILFGPTDWFLLKDPLLQRVHATITGFQPMSVLFRGNASWVGTLLSQLGILPVSLAIAAYLSISRRTAARHSALALAALVPAVISSVLTLRYVRAGGLNIVTLSCLAFVVFACLGDRGAPAGRRRLGLVLAALMLAANVHVWHQSWQAHYPFVGRDLFHPDWVRKLAFRDVSHALGRNVPGLDRIAMTSSDLAPGLYYFGGFSVTAGLYWENRDGLAASIDFFGARDDAEARGILTERGIRYVVFWSVPAAVARWHELRYGTADGSGVRGILAFRLATGPTPDWLEEVTDLHGASSRRHGVRILRVR